MVALEASEQILRIDKWLWAARFFKSRSLACEAIELGRVHINGERVKPARLVKLDDKVQIYRGVDRIEVFVRFLSGVRRSASLAQALYDETAESQTARQLASESRRFYAEPTRNLAGRPTKRNRRAIERFSQDEN
ncbi:MAG: S4 domain-containing protein [Orrella sp.]|jgi:ribosome-associated heat shock protein Hsp15|uniref:RNA-binding S4 domain-containing protein n=1 Tax=Orrella sp. TaxID=1921583 RepID=UPI003BDACB9D